MYRFDYEQISYEHFVIDSITNIKYILNPVQYENMCEFERSYGRDYRRFQDAYLLKLLNEGALIQYVATFWNDRM